MTMAFSVKLIKETLENFDKSTPPEDYRHLINQTREQIYSDYLNNVSAAKIVKHYTTFIDLLIGHVWTRANFDGQAISLLAVGGYGRSELHPFSDIDLLIGCYRAINPHQNEQIGLFIRFLWDIGLEVGHSVRTIKQSIQLAKKDITVLTTLMESRRLIDERGFTEELLKKLNSKKFWPAQQYMTAKVNEQQQRHLAFDDTEYNLEPNLKDGPGGLRDIQTIVWVAGRHYNKVDLNVLSEEKILNTQESKALIRCRNFLWKLRIGLHLHAQRKEDRLLFDHQRSLAKDFGYQDAKNHLAVELLMKRFYRTAKEIRLLNQTLIQFFQETSKASNLPVKKINQRFNDAQGYLETANATVFLEYPPALLEIFYLLQANPDLKGIRANTIRQITKSLPKVSSKIRQYQDTKDIFMRILKHPGGQTHALRNMDTYGVLAAFIPAYHRIVGQMQHDLFHVYTVDAHSLFVLRNLRRFCLVKHQAEEPDAYNVMGQVTKRERLFLAALFHDIAKGRGGDHSVLGEKETLRFCQYLGLSKVDCSFIAWLVRHHLAMSFTAQREDISDPNVISKFALLVGDQQHLSCLYLLTIADIKATGPKVWSRWKGKLLWDLYLATSRRLSHELPASDDVNNRINEAKEAVIKRLRRNIPHHIVEEFWHSLAPNYFLHFGTDAIYWQQQTLLSAAAHEIPLTNMRHNEDLEANQILVYAPEHDTLLPIVSGAIDHLHFSIINAQIERLKNGMSLLAFVTTDQNGQAVTESWRQQEAKDYINKLLRQGHKDLQPKKRLMSRRSKHFPINTQVSFEQSETGNLTIMQVTAQDRPGLLYHITSALLTNKIHLHTARINTLGERVEDHFFISDRDGRQIKDAKMLGVLEDSILTALGR